MLNNNSDFSKCLGFDGANDYAKVIDNTFLKNFFENQGRDPITNPLVFSVCLAFKGYTPINSINAQVFGNANSINTIGLDICFRTDFGSTFCVGLRNNAAIRILKFVNANFNVNDKNFVVITYNGSRTTAGININVNNITPPTTNELNSLSNETTVSNNDFLLGINPINFGYCKALLYDRILTNTEIQDFNIEKLPSNPIRFYDFKNTINNIILERIAQNSAQVYNQPPPKNTFRKW